MPISLESNLSETATNKNLIAAIEAELPAFRTMSVATEKNRSSNSLHYQHQRSFYAR